MGRIEGGEEAASPEEGHIGGGKVGDGLLRWKGRRRLGVSRVHLFKGQGTRMTDQNSRLNMWSGGSEVKSTCRGPWFGSQH